MKILNFFSQHKNKFLLGFGAAGVGLLSYNMPQLNLIATNMMINTIDFSKLNKEKARKLLPDILDAAQVPHGDMAVSGKKIHSGRYVISQWQRAAIGAIILPIYRDNKGETYIVLGIQRGYLRNPQGYMEIPLPQEDLTGLRRKGASRINGKSGELIPHDNSLEDNAKREIYEESNIKIKKKDLVLLGIRSNTKDNPITFAAQYMVEVDNMSKLSVNDTEFVEDDLQKPFWYKVSDIKFDDKEQKYFGLVNNQKIFLDDSTAEIIKMSLEKMGIKSHIFNISKKSSNMSR